MNPRSVRRNGVTETGIRVAIRPVKLVQDILGRANSHVKATRLVVLFISIEQCVCNECSAYEIRPAARDQQCSCLPRKTISPAPIGTAAGAKQDQILDQPR